MAELKDSKKSIEKTGEYDSEKHDNNDAFLLDYSENVQIVNASGHQDQLKRHYGLLSICGLALAIDNAWVALGGTITVSIANGGPAGVLYELLVAGAYYMLIAASIAELTSSIPSAGGVYHWSSIISGPRYGRVVGFFAGSINFFGWMFDLASVMLIPANVLQMYAVFRPDFIIETWHIYVAYVLLTWVTLAMVVFGNKLLPFINHCGLVLILGGGLVTIIVCAAMPTTRADSSFVWGSFNENNITGWPSGVAFLTGVLNGAFTIGTPDAVTKMGEELPEPKRDMPKAVLLQVALGTITAFLFAITIFYAISDLDAVVSSNGSFPLAVIYYQATGSAGGTFGLLLILFLSTIVCAIDTYLTVGRMWWALARDDAVPFSKLFSSVNENLSCPVPATIFAAVLCTGLGAIQLGSKTAFNDLVGSFVILTSASYVMAILPHLLTGRRNITPGPFWMGKAGFVVNGLSVFFIVFFDILYCFPYAYPTDVPTMNYNSVILVGAVLLTAFWWVVYGMRNYPGPRVAGLLLGGVEVGEVVVGSDK